MSTGLFIFRESIYLSVVFFLDEYIFQEYTSRV